MKNVTGAKTPEKKSEGKRKQATLTDAVEESCELARKGRYKDGDEREDRSRKNRWNDDTVKQRKKQRANV